MQNTETREGVVGYEFIKTFNRHFGDNSEPKVAQTLV
jgi:hypothetical protein